MKEINIARTIINKRKEKGLTQDELASYIGVSKAAVSKWEIGQSYPDITFLPQLATFFNISIDELMGYEPQMSKEDIHKLYVSLSCEFAVKPFDDVMEECRKIIKKYFSCFPLLFQIGTLIVNNSMEAGDKDRSVTAIEEAKELFIRIKSESEDAELCRLALNMEAFCALSLGKAEEVIELLERTYRRALAVIETFDLKNLHPALLVKFYFNLLEEWIDTLDLGASLPRNEKIICKSMVDGVVRNPAFTALSAEPQFQRIVERLKSKLLGGAI